MLVFTEAFPKQTFQRISLYRGRYLLSCQRKTETWAHTGIFSNQDRYTGIATPNIVLKYLLKIERSR
jgi:hypothetical protein